VVAAIASLEGDFLKFVVKVFEVYNIAVISESSPGGYSSFGGSSFLSLSPPADKFAAAAHQFLLSNDWTHFGVLWQENFTAELPQAAVQGASTDRGSHSIYFDYQYSFSDTTSMQQALRELKAKHIRVFLAVVEPQAANGLLQVAKTLGLVGPRHVWVLTRGQPGGGFEEAAEGSDSPSALLSLADGMFTVVSEPMGNTTRWAEYMRSHAGRNVSSLMEAYPEYFCGVGWEPPPLAALESDGGDRVRVQRANMYDAVTMLAQALQRRGRVSARELVREMAASPFDGLGGAVALDAAGNRVLSECTAFNHRLRQQGGLQELRAIPVARLSWSEDEGRWGFQRTGRPFHFHGGSEIPPQDNFHCPRGVCELCVVLPPGPELLAALLAVDLLNGRDASVVPSLTHLIAGEMILRPRILREEPSQLRRISSECSNIHGRPADFVIGASDEMTSQSLHQILGSVPQISPWGSASSGHPEQRSTFAHMLPPDSDAAGAALVVLEHLGWRHIGFLVEDAAETSSLALQIKDRMLTAGRTDAVLRRYFSDRGTALAACQEMKDSGIRVVLLVVKESLQVPALAASDAGMSGEGYGWLAVMPSSTSPDTSLSALTSSGAEALDGWLLLTMSADMPESSRSAFMTSACRLNLTHYKDKYPEARDLLDKTAGLSLCASPEDIPLTALTAFDSVYSAAFSLSYSGSHEDTNLQKALSAVNFTGITGNVSFSGSSTRRGILHTLWSLRAERDGVQTLQFLRLRISASRPEVHEVVDPGHVRWPGGASGVPSDGFSCGDGYRFDPGSLECRPCAPGFARSSVGSPSGVCSPCPPGTFCDREGCKQCIPCSEGTFQDGSAATSCNECPSGAVTLLRESSSIEDCRCALGFFRLDASTGLECEECPMNGVCPGGGALPLAASGAWGNISITRSVAFRQQNNLTQIHMLQRHLFHLCSKYGGVCRGQCSDALAAAEGNASSCQDTPNICGSGHRGRMCAACEKGYFRMLGKCRQCPPQQYLFVFGGLLAVVLVWFLLNKVVANRYESLSLMLLWLQLATMISSFDMNWHPNLQLIFQLLYVVNFDIDFFTPECIMSSPWTYLNSMLVELFLPLTWLLFNLMTYSLNKLLLRLKDSKAANAVLYVLRMARTEEELASGVDYRVAGTMSFLGITYHTTAIKSLKAFVCTRLPDGSSFLNANPEIVCHSGTHRLYMAFGSIGLVLYSIGMPAAISWILWRGRKDRMLDSPQFQRRFGWLYLKFEAEWYWWELMILARRLAFAFLVVFGSEYPSLQGGIGIAILLMSMGAHFYSRAFYDVVQDIQESLQLCSLIAMIIIGQLFMDTELMGRMSQLGWILSMVLIVLMSTSIFCVLLLAIWQIVAVEKRIIATRFLEDLSGMKESREESDADSNDISRLPKLHHAFNSDALFVWVQGIRRQSKRLKNAEGNRRAAIDNLEGRETSTSWTGALKINARRRLSLCERELQYSGEGSQSSRGALSKRRWTIPEKLKIVPQPGRSIRMKASNASIAKGLWNLNTRLFEVYETKEPGNHPEGHQCAMVPCKTSYYAFDFNSRFCNMIAENMPFLIDYLLKANQEQRLQALSLLRELQSHGEQAQHSMSLSHLIVHKERPTVLCWLLNAGQEDVELACRVLGSILAEVKKRDGQRFRIGHTQRDSNPWLTNLRHDIGHVFSRTLRHLSFHMKGDSEFEAVRGDEHVVRFSGVGEGSMQSVLRAVTLTGRLQPQGAGDGTPLCGAEEPPDVEGHAGIQDEATGKARDEGGDINRRKSKGYLEGIVSWRTFSNRIHPRSTYVCSSHGV